MQEKKKKIFVGLSASWTVASAAVCYRMKHNSLLAKIGEHPLGGRLLNDRVFRACVSLYAGLASNCLYAVLQLIAAVCCHSLWFGALTMYHTMLAVMRFPLQRHINWNRTERNMKEEWRQYRFCGVVLLFMTPVFVSILILVVHKGSHAGYHGFLIYLMAVYAFFKVIIAVGNMIKFRKSESPVISAAKSIDLVAVVMSVLSLETALLSRFGSGGNPIFYQGMLGTSGGGVCIFVLGMAVYMVVCSSKKMKASEK